MATTSSLYDQDFYAWAHQQAKLIKAKAFDKLDIAHLYEEVEDMGNRHADELESRLEILLMHLLSGSINLICKKTPGNSPSKNNEKE